jgi:hypothetical protein
MHQAEAQPGSAKVGHTDNQKGTADQPRRRSRRPDRSERSLVCLVQSLVQRRIVIELRNDIIVRGHVDSVDEYMK